MKMMYLTVQLSKKIRPDLSPELTELQRRLFQILHRQITKRGTRSHSLLHLVMEHGKIIGWLVLDFILCCLSGQCRCTMVQGNARWRCCTSPDIFSRW